MEDHISLGHITNMGGIPNNEELHIYYHGVQLTLKHPEAIKLLEKLDKKIAKDYQILTEKTEEFWERRKEYYSIMKEMRKVFYDIQEHGEFLFKREIKDVDVDNFDKLSCSFAEFFELE